MLKAVPFSQFIYFVGEPSREKSDGKTSEREREVGVENHFCKYSVEIKGMEARRGRSE